MYGFIDVDRTLGLWDGYAEYQYLAADSMVLSLPASLDPILATLFNPLEAGIRWVQRCQAPVTAMSSPYSGQACAGFVSPPRRSRQVRGM